MKRYLLVISLVLVSALASQSKRSPTPKVRSHDLLTKIGLQRVHISSSHHRKRLAVESRHHARSDDSHIFIVKLPPNPHYYVHNLPTDGGGATTTSNHIPDAPAENIPVGFKSNGKPGKIYHWNIPVIKKIVKKHKLRRNNYINSEFNNFDVDDPASWNEVLDKPSVMAKESGELLRGGSALKPVYYVPAKPKKASFTKYFPGNGKPHSFYVIERSKKAHYHRLLP